MLLISSIGGGGGKNLSLFLKYQLKNKTRSNSQNKLAKNFKDFLINSSMFII
jgi:hypothetical protein